ncbi:20955_t:CDS:2 [Dentiscutata erythropus]|uniref:20955_t:CDS:1 n=1 Tax=Dentiscutata erythropus TaxID=1348616 RepID=A0A9N8ZG06_9GLOM|nr:20955_t:CDS:2 [Dentiscutata erythropus]
MVNTINPEGENDKPFAVGILFFQQNPQDSHCTASVISTNDGNTGITAAHCLYDTDTGCFSDHLKFCPGYDNGKESRYGCVAVIKANIPTDYINHSVSDYATLKWSRILIVTFGYPQDGDMNCAEDRRTFCSWRGNASKENDSSVPLECVPPFLGHGSSGDPWLIKNSPPNNFGYLIGITSFAFTKTCSDI